MYKKIWHWITFNGCYPIKQNQTKPYQVPHILALFQTKQTL